MTRENVFPRELVLLFQAGRVAFAHQGRINHKTGPFSTTILGGGHHTSQFHSFLWKSGNRNGFSKRRAGMHHLSLNCSSQEMRPLPIGALLLLRLPTFRLAFTQISLSAP